MSEIGFGSGRISPEVDQGVTFDADKAGIDDKVSSDKSSKKTAEGGQKKAVGDSRVKEKMAAKVQSTGEAGDKKDEKSPTAGKLTQAGGPSGKPKVDEAKTDGYKVSAIEGNLTEGGETINELSDALGEIGKLLDSEMFADDVVAADKAHRKATQENAKRDLRKRDALRSFKRLLAMLGTSTDMGDDSQGRHEKTNVARKMLASSQGEVQRGAGEHGGVMSGALTTDETPELDREHLNERALEAAAKLIDLSARLATVDLADEVTEEIISKLDLLERLHSKLRDVLDPVLSGEYGALRGESFDQLKTLFQRVRTWPVTVPPGFPCRKGADGALTWNAQDWNQFLAWVKQPPPRDPAEPILS